MSIERDIFNLQNTLQVPISNIVHKGSYAEIFSDGTNIGSLYVYNQAGITSFDTSEAVLNNLKWHIIYEKYKNVFNALAQEANLAKDIAITAATFGHFYVKEINSDALIGYYKCVFIRPSWSIFKVS